MRAKELRDRSIEELEAQNGDLARELYHLRCEHRTGQVEKPHSLKAKRRDRARVLTLLGEKKRAKQIESESRS